MTPISQSVKRDIGFYLVVIVVAALAWAFENHMSVQAYNEIVAQGGVSGTVITQLDAVQTKEFDAFLDLNQQVTTLETALMGGVFYLLFNSRKGSAWRHRRSALIGSLLVSISIYFGFVSYSYFIVTLQNGNPDPTTGLTRVAQQAHFYTFLLGVIFFANFIFHNLPEENKT
jgi:hypothetical protein